MNRRPRFNRPMKSPRSMRGASGAPSRAKSGGCYYRPPYWWDDYYYWPDWYWYDDEYYDDWWVEDEYYDDYYYEASKKAYEQGYKRGLAHGERRAKMEREVPIEDTEKK